MPRGAGIAAPERPGSAAFRGSGAAPPTGRAVSRNRYPAILTLSHVVIRRPLPFPDFGR
jgi:hypothetical protein